MLEAVDGIFSKLGGKQIPIDDIFRLGKASQRGPRPLLVKLLRNLDVKFILKNKKNLGKEKIFIDKDKSIQERAKEKKLRDEFNVLKRADNGIRMAFSKGSLLVLKGGGVVIKTLSYDEDQDVIHQI
ncbi:hypothetical protein Fcan01_11396 [Folsomia candida]|uniref:Uncharacterized protein n=1 Tax=Folsomia candida TaxID=158441 RepID=A0A226EBG0_FOLCA|nr:hypothetical protein Fcan01_11396 [Folsomia candida]